MLCTLRVKDLLLVREATIDLAAGLSVLSGETGTGKSILLGALALLLGGRGSASWVRPGAKALHVEGVFRGGQRVRVLLREMGVPAEGDELILARQMDTGGRSRCFINGHRVLVTGLRRCGSQLVEMHGQRQEERFRIAEVQRDLLDLYAKHGDLRHRVRAAWDAAQEAAHRADRHQARIEKLRGEEDWLRFQVSEIDQIDPRPDEVGALRERVRALRAAAEQVELAELAERLLNGREGAILESVEELDHALARTEQEPDWTPLREQVRALRLQAREAYRELQSLRRAGGQELEELGRLEERLSKLERLERKHRRTLPEILALAGEMRASLADLAAAEEQGETLARERAAAEAHLAAEASRLRRGRQKAGPTLARALQRELDALGMRGVRLRVALEPLGESSLAGDSAKGARGESDGDDGAPLRVGPQGSERVIFEIETNPGEGFRPLGEIASGGEMSRIALAIRVVLGSAGRARLTVFDEIDAGLGGAAAKAVAQRLDRVSRHRQVLLVTHLPIIAAAAESHFRVWKEKRGGRNVAFVEPVSGEERVGEVARMLAGDAQDGEARKHAEVLLAGR